MRNLSISLRRGALLGLAVLCAAIGVSAAAVAAGGTATSSKAGKVKVKCPAKVLRGKKVTCKVFGRLPAGPQGPQGLKGSKGAKGDKGRRETKETKAPPARRVSPATR
jgi:hypothetical protein